MAVPDAGCGGGAERRLFSWQFPDAICGGWGGGGCYGSPIFWLWVGAELYVHMAVLDAGCGGFLMAVPISFCWGNGIPGSSWQSQMLVVGGDRVFMAGP